MVKYEKKCISVYLTKSEYSKLLKAAEKDERPISVYIKLAALKEAKRKR